MKNNKIIFSSVIVVIGVVLLFSMNKKLSLDSNVNSYQDFALKKNKTQNLNEMNSQKALKKNLPGEVNNNQNSITTNATKSNALSSISQLAGMLSQVSRPEQTLNDLLKSLQVTNQKPFIFKDKNPYTGQMTIVRTENPMPGTRYFHAQYFSDETGKDFAQHVSFQFRPGPNAFNEALVEVSKSFGGLHHPSFEKKDFRQWDLNDGYVLWIKQMGAEDLKNSPYNAYTNEDIGRLFLLT